MQGILVRNNWALLVGVCRIPQEDLQLILEFIEEISRNAKSVQEIQEILSKELCGYYKRSVGVSVVKGNEKHDL